MKRKILLDSPGQRMLVKDDPNIVVRCVACGRKLTSARAVKLRLGRVCRRRREGKGARESSGQGAKGK